MITAMDMAILEAERQVWVHERAIEKGKDPFLKGLHVRALERAQDSRDRVLYGARLIEDGRNHS